MRCLILVAVILPTFAVGCSKEPQEVVIRVVDESGNDIMRVNVDEMTSRLERRNRLKTIVTETFPDVDEMTDSEVLLSCGLRYEIDKPWAAEEGVTIQDLVDKLLADDPLAPTYLKLRPKYPQLFRE